MLRRCALKSVGGARILSRHGAAMKSSLHLFSLPLEIREEIFFYLIAVIFGRRYGYDKDLGRHILRPGFMFLWVRRGYYVKPGGKDLTRVLVVSRRMRAEVESVLYRRFSFSFDNLSIQDRTYWHRDPGF